MESRVTAKIKISASTQVVRTIAKYSKGLQFCVDTAWEKKIRNNIKLYPFVYARLRKTLPAQLAIGCIKQACAMVKKAKSKPIISKASVRYNFPRSARLRDGVLSLRLLKSCEKFSLDIPN